MLGRFVFTSSLSRRSSRGFRVGSSRFGFCCCESGLLNVFTISIPIHPLFAIQSATSAAPSPIPASRTRTVLWRCSAILIWVRPRPITCSGGPRDFYRLFPPPTRRETSTSVDPPLQGLSKILRLGRSDPSSTRPTHPFAGLVRERLERIEVR